MMSCGGCADHVAGYDRHGFAVFDDNYDPEGERCHSCYRSDSEAERHVIAWQRLLAEWDLSDFQIVTKLRKQVKNGVPPHLRGAIWKKFLDMEELRMTSGFDYKLNLALVRDQLVDLGISEYCSDTDTLGHLAEMEEEYKSNHSNINVDCIRQILLDLDRSYPTHRRYMAGTPEGKEGRAALFRVLAVFARYNPEVGYCQGMSYVAGLLLLYMSETDAFWCMVSLLERHKYLRGYFDKGMKRIQRHGVVFERLLKRSFPAISKRLASLDVNSIMYVIPWFLAIFTTIHCWESVLAIWDLFLLEGIKSLFQAGLALMSILKADILKSKGLNTLLPLLLHPPKLKLHFNMLVPPIWKMVVEEWEVVRLEADVHEEHRLQQSHGCKRSRSMRDEGEEEMDVDDLPASAKKPRSVTRGPQRSVFQRLVNIFTPREQRLGLPNSSSCTSHSGRRRLRSGGSQRKRHHSKTPAKIHVSPCEEASENGGLVNKNLILEGTPVRRSPRLIRQRALQEINAANVSRNAAVEFTIQSLQPPIILGQPQTSNSSPSSRETSGRTSRHLEMEAVVGTNFSSLTHQCMRTRRQNQPSSAGSTPNSRSVVTPRRIHTPMF